MNPWRQGSFWHSTKNKTTSQNCTAISHTPEITYNSLSQHIVVSVTKIAVINSTRDSLHMILSSIYSMIRVKSSIFDLQSYKSSYIGRKSSILRHNSKHPQSLINQYLCQNLFFNDKTSNLQTSWDRKSTRLNSSHVKRSRMPSSAWKKKKQTKRSITSTNIKTQTYER